jgi:hypothetical protein
MLKKLAVTLAFWGAILVASSRAQEPGAIPTPKAKKIHWQKYVSKEFGFALTYPDSYQPASDLEFCKDNEYRKYLLCLVKRDDPDATILVTIIVREPFFIKTNRDDTKYAPHKIGKHLFYCGTQGSMGTGFSDECTYDLKNKTLEISYSPTNTINTDIDLNPLMLKSLKALRAF